MSYCFSKKIEGPFEAARDRAIAALKTEGFGVLTEINVQETLKKKIDVDFYPYVILGACNPTLAHKALMAEDKIGTMLPCNVILQQKDRDGLVEVSAVDPASSMSAVENEGLGAIAEQVQNKLKAVIEKL